ncbi:hypothetical protein JHK85_019016 [Glycine max]|nr:hypothetical protein JHK87_018480 [Glycine soja]KAG5011379.1 hypothetical protein JHK87_019894 [Glycine soja]KAG5022674.1 hypothetical protein JHK85_019016 [Glycine max]KAG5037769.1 hypothetical protein JHK86_018609 [Glycine max]
MHGYHKIIYTLCRAINHQRRTLINLIIRPRKLKLRYLVHFHGVISDKWPKGRYRKLVLAIGIHIHGYLTINNWRQCAGASPSSITVLKKRLSVISKTPTFAAVQLSTKQKTSTTAH